MWNRVTLATSQNPSERLQLKDTAAGSADEDRFLNSGGSTEDALLYGMIR